MPTTAKFKSKLYAHASKATNPRRTGAKSKPTKQNRVTDSTGESAAPGGCAHAEDSTTLHPTERTMSNLPNRGPLLDPKAVAVLIFPGTKPRDLVGKMKWVREHVPSKVSLGHKTVAWFEADVRWWLEDRRGA